jgi:hypothetical protein
MQKRAAALQPSGQFVFGMRSGVRGRGNERSMTGLFTLHRRSRSPVVARYRPCYSGSVECSAVKMLRPMTTVMGHRMTGAVIARGTGLSAAPPGGESAGHWMRGRGAVQNQRAVVRGRLVLASVRG